MVANLTEFDEESAAIEEAVREESVSSFAALVSYYRALAAEYKAESFARSDVIALQAGTIRLLRELMHFHKIGPPVNDETS